ncbi:hypothetical protein LguiA_012783 [Lonicera macranthoides]
MELNTMKEFRNYIRTYAILKKFVWEYMKNDGDRARLKCHDEECNWICYAKQKRNEAIVVEGTAVGRTFAALKNYQVDGNKEMIAIEVMNIVGSSTSCYVTIGYSYLPK